jgi:hypothetical protein
MMRRFIWIVGGALVPVAQAWADLRPDPSWAPEASGSGMTMVAVGAAVVVGVGGLVWFLRRRGGGDPGAGGAES